MTTKNFISTAADTRSDRKAPTEVTPLHGAGGGQPDTGSPLPPRSVLSLLQEAAEQLIKDVGARGALLMGELDEPTRSSLETLGHIRKAIRSQGGGILR